MLKRFTKYVTQSVAGMIGISRAFQVLCKQKKLM